MMREIALCVVVVLIIALEIWGTHMDRRLEAWARGDDSS